MTETTQEEKKKKKKFTLPEKGHQKQRKIWKPPL